jgi:tetratricopeptide (TPR) repeat protein
MTRQSARYRAWEDRKTQVVYRSLANFLTLFLLFGLLPVALSPKAVRGTLAPIRQSTQGATQEPGGASQEQDARPLEQGQVIKRELASGQQHSYRIRLSAGQFLKAAVAQQGIDLVVQVRGPDGNQIFEFDSESRQQGQELAQLVAEIEGAYRLNVRPKQKSAGGYEIRIEELRAATERDRALQEARKLNYESLKLQRAGKYDEALSLAERVPEIRERLLGPDHREVADSLNDLAILYHYKGEYAKAEPLFQRALAIWEKVLGPEHPDVAASLNNLANIHRDKGEYAKAEPLYRRALTIWEESLGAEHPQIATALNNLANLYSDRGEYTKAEPLFQRALALQEKALGAEHPDLVIPINNLAVLYWNKGDYVKAEPLLNRALAIREKALGPHHRLVAESLNYIARLYAAKGDTARAVTFQSRANAVIEQNLVPNLATGSERQRLAYLALSSNFAHCDAWLLPQRSGNSSGRDGRSCCG